MKIVNLVNGPVRFEGALSMEITPQGVIPWRLNYAERDLLPPELTAGAKAGSGVRLTMQTDARQISLICHTDVPEHCLVDLAVDDQRVETRVLQPPGRQELHFTDLPHGPKRVELWLPNYGTTVVESLAVNDDAVVGPWHDRRNRWVTHGSSLTHCRRANSPMRAWPSMVAQAMGWHLSNLGFGGQCKMDPIVARTIAAMPADLISLCLGINTYDADFTPRTWPQAALGFLLTIRDKQPDTPVVVFSPMVSPPRETTPGKTGLTLVAMRQWLAEIVDKLRARGDQHIVHVDGHQVFGPLDANLMPDALHPGGDGIELMGRRITQIFRDKLPEIGGEPLLPR